MKYMLVRGIICENFIQNKPERIRLARFLLSWTKGIITCVVKALGLCCSFSLNSLYNTDILSSNYNFNCLLQILIVELTRTSHTYIQGVTNEDLRPIT